MITHHKVDGYENFLKLMKILDCKAPILLYFHGSSSPSGMSWSTSCNTSGPVILEILKKNETKNFHFVAVGVGTSQEWADRGCPFRKHEKVLLRTVPTLILWRSNKRLSGQNCAQPEKVKQIIDFIK